MRMIGTVARAIRQCRSSTSVDRRQRFTHAVPRAASPMRSPHVDRSAPERRKAGQSCSRVSRRLRQVSFPGGNARNHPLYFHVVLIGAGQAAALSLVLGKWSAVLALPASFSDECLL